jgi:Clp amino terminal domain, pathogenicity island component
MFERYTEKARRVIFFARYEASQYGSKTIDTEHLLLGLLREDSSLRMRLLSQPGAVESIRKQIESTITPREGIPTTVELPLSADSKEVLNLGAEEADRLGYRYIGTEHILLGLLSVDKSVAATILAAHKVTLAGFRDFLASSAAAKPVAARGLAPHGDQEKATLLAQNFLEALRAGLKEESQEFFTENAQYIDREGMRWTGKNELLGRLAELFAPFAARNVKCEIVETMPIGEDICLVSVLCEDVPFADKPTKGLCWMTVALGWESLQAGEWSIYSIQVTAVMRA